MRTFGSQFTTQDAPNQSAVDLHPDHSGGLSERLEWAPFGWKICPTAAPSFGFDGGKVTEHNYNARDQ